MKAALVGGLVVVVVGLATAAFLVTRTDGGQIRPVLTAACLDDSDDVREEHAAGDLIAAVDAHDPSMFQVWYTPGTAPNIDIVSVSLRLDDDVLIIEAELADDWTADNFLSGNSDVTLGSNMAVTLILASGEEHFVDLDPFGGIKFRRAAGEDPIFTAPLNPKGRRAVARIPVDTVDLGSRFQWHVRTWEVKSTMAGTALVAQAAFEDHCGLSEEPIDFPNAQQAVPAPASAPSTTTAPTTTSSAPAPTTALAPSSTIAPSPPSPQPVDLSSQLDVAKALNAAWNDADPAAAAAVASDEAVRFMFSEPTNRNATLTRCRHYTEIPEGEYQEFGTFVCDGTFDADGAAGQTVELYIDGGVSGGYSVSAVSFNRNPPGWRPVD